MDRMKLGGGLRLLATGEIVMLASLVGMLGSALLMLEPLLSDRPANAFGLLRLGSFLLLISSLATIAGAVIRLVGQVKLRGEHRDYYLAMLLTIAALGLNFLLSFLELAGLWIDLLKLLLPCLSLYLTVRATNGFLAQRDRGTLVRRGWIALTVYLTVSPLGVFFSWGLAQVLKDQGGVENDPALAVGTAVAAVLISLIPGILTIRYFRGAAEELSREVPEELPAGPEIE